MIRRDLATNTIMYDPERSSRIPNYHVDWKNHETSPQGYIDRPIPKDEDVTEGPKKRKSESSHYKPKVAVEPLDVDGHWAFPNTPPNEEAIDTLTELQEHPCGSYFVCTEGLLSPIERLGKTQEVLYQVPDSISAGLILNYFQDRIDHFSHEWVETYLEKFSQDTDLQVYVPTEQHVTSARKLQIACQTLRPAHIPKAAEIFLKSLKNPIELAELRVKIDFTRIAMRFEDPTLTVDELFPEGEDMVENIKTWIQSNKEKLAEKELFLIPPHIQTIPPALLKSMPNINSVKLAHGDFIVTPYKAIKNILTLPKLEHLNLSHNRLTDFPIGLLDTAKKLKVLNLSGNLFSEHTKTTLQNYCARREIDLMI